MFVEGRRRDENIDVRRTKMDCKQVKSGGDTNTELNFNDTLALRR